MSAPATGSRAHVAPERQAARLRELAAVFLRLGLTAFGGPAYVLALPPWTDAQFP